MNILLCGVGGQGTVLASRIIASAAMERGEYAVTAETIGMAQRGGSVVSHVRTGRSSEIFSPLIPRGQADLIIGTEPGEAVRSIQFLKPGGKVVVSSAAAYAVTCPKYDGAEALEWLRRNTDCLVIDTEKLFEKVKNPKVLNVALLGAAAGQGCLDLESIERVLEKKLKPQLVELNKLALHTGVGMVGNK